MIHSRGFTLIEILIVLAVLGILGGIAVPKLTAAKEQAYTAAMIAELRLANLYEEQYAIEKGGKYFSGTVTDETPVEGFSTSKGITITLAAGTSAKGTPTWSAAARHAGTDKVCEMLNGAIICLTPSTAATGEIASN
jgi:prepilin-type N-terminal cleavage/methylation domain-containing protein